MEVVVLKQNFLNNLTHAMSRLGFDQQRLANESGVHDVTISRILNGHYVPDVATCEKLANAVGIEPQKIFCNPRKRG